MVLQADWSISQTSALMRYGSLSPWISISLQFDFGYDIANYTNVDKDYGILADFDKLAGKIKSLGLKVILDFVSNHSSYMSGSRKASDEVVRRVLRLTRIVNSWGVIEQLAVIRMEMEFGTEIVLSASVQYCSSRSQLS
ncbi:hypothetical protein P5V15_005681 [Pogonomyrmex californicus]